MTRDNARSILGTTSAHAENTWPRQRGSPEQWNYLRARGEYGDGHYASTAVVELPPRTRRIPPSREIFRPPWELPPRTRRIRRYDTVVGVEHGTTSAHAENTPRGAQWTRGSWNYLRARGEYIASAASASAAAELPPRTRRIQYFGRQNWQKFGTTSAHAENTADHIQSWAEAGNYLRARGEYPR